MTGDQKDLGSDASRTDSKTADRAREELAKQAERGIERAMGGKASAGSDDHPEQDPAEGSLEPVKRDLARKDKAGKPRAESGQAKQVTKEPLPGSEAAEPCLSDDSSGSLVSGVALVGSRRHRSETSKRPIIADRPLCFDTPSS
jgi:hypothetical protein